MSSTWMIDERDFYEAGTEAGRMEFLLRYAILAPSGHNTQPWSFKITREGVEVFADFSRRLVVADHDDRELLMSVGAAITNFRVAAAHFGFETTVFYEPRPTESLPVAVIVARETSEPDAALATLFPAIPHRHTNRAPFDGQPIDPAVLSALCDLVDAHPETLRLILTRDKAFLADWIESADHEIMDRPEWRLELAEWIHKNGEGSDVRLLDTASALLLVMAEDDRVSLVRAGEVLERLLLTLTAFGLHYSFLNQVIEIDDLRERVQQLAVSAHPPQLLLRIGSAHSIAEPTPRRPVDAVVTIAR